MEKKLRDAIASELQRVTISNAPKIYSIIQSVDGYKAIEEAIIRMMLTNNITASAAIIQLEGSKTDE